MTREAATVQRSVYNETATVNTGLLWWLVVRRNAFLNLTCTQPCALFMTSSSQDTLLLIFTRRRTFDPIWPVTCIKTITLTDCFIPFQIDFLLAFKLPQVQTNLLACLLIQCLPPRLALVHLIQFCLPFLPSQATTSRWNFKHNEVFD